MQEYISESVEPPTNPQFLNSSRHVKWSLHNLRNIRKLVMSIIPIGISPEFLNIFIRKLLIIKCMTKIENFAESRKVAHILKVWSLLSTKIPISSRSVENSSVMSHSPAAPPEFTNPAQIFFPKL
jgi:hypothetical protein